MRQVEHNAKLTSLELPELKTVDGYIYVRACPRPRSADRALSRAHRAGPPLPLSWRVATRASGAR